MFVRLSPALAALAAVAFVAPAADAGIPPYFTSQPSYGPAATYDLSQFPRRTTAQGCVESAGLFYSPQRGYYFQFADGTFAGPANVPGAADPIAGGPPQNGAAVDVAPGPLEARGYPASSPGPNVLTPTPAGGAATANYSSGTNYGGGNVGASYNAGPVGGMSGPSSSMSSYPMFQPNGAPTVTPNYGGTNFGGSTYGTSNYGGGNFGGGNFGGGTNYGTSNYGGTTDVPMLSPGSGRMNTPMSGPPSDMTGGR